METSCCLHADECKHFEEDDYGAQMESTEESRVPNKYDLDAWNKMVREHNSKIP